MLCFIIIAELEVPSKLERLILHSRQKMAKATYQSRCFRFHQKVHNSISKFCLHVQKYHRIHWSMLLTYNPWAVQHWYNAWKGLFNHQYCSCIVQQVVQNCRFNNLVHGCSNKGIQLVLKNACEQLITILLKSMNNIYSSDINKYNIMFDLVSSRLFNCLKTSWTGYVIPKAKR